MASKAKQGNLQVFEEPTRGDMEGRKEGGKEQKVSSCSQLPVPAAEQNNRPAADPGMAIVRPDIGIAAWG